MKKIISLLGLITIFNFNSLASSDYRIDTNNKSVNNCCFDLIVIGAGSSGFRAVLEASRPNRKILLINGGLPLGGTCLNVGCIPSKYLVNGANYIGHFSAPHHPGIDASKPSLHFKKFINEKNDYQYGSWTRNYKERVAKMKDLTIIEGIARFKTNEIVEVNGKEYTSKRFIIATGASPKIPKIEGLDKIEYHTNRTLYKIEKKPESMVILGSGFIALETACMFAQMGTKVRIINNNDILLDKHLSRELSDEAEKYLTQLGIEIFHDFDTYKIEKHYGTYHIHCKQKGFKDIELKEENCIVICTGHKPNTKHLRLEKANVKTTEDGHIIVSDTMQTSNHNIYAVGDCVNTPPYLYTASKEGHIAAFNVFSKNTKKKINYTALPWVVFANPQIAGVGLTEQQLKATKIPYTVAKAPMRDVPLSGVSQNNTGIFEILIDKNTDKILGATIIAKNAGDVIMIISLAIKFNITASKLKNSFFPYLTLAEGIQTALYASK